MAMPSCSLADAAAVPAIHRDKFAAHQGAAHAQKSLI
jgi:hypothetical protein